METIDGAVWTEKNEQVFIQLMEIEVRNGNRQTTTFSPSTWSRILQGLERATNRKYKQYQLKNKFNSLRTRWRDFSTILKENRVAYNATTGQVIATSDVWAKLLKVNRSASCLMYESLCRIYGDTTATGRLQHPFTKVIIDDVVWTEKNEQVFIQLMENEVINGNRQTTTFSPSAWSRILQGLERATNRKYKQDQLKNKFNSLRTRWRDFSTILKENRVAYNATTGQVIGTSDVWAKLLKVNRSASCLMYESLCRIYGDTTATGRLQHPFTKVIIDEAVWTKNNEKVFIQLMENEVINGNRQTTTFSPSAWSRILQGLERATNRKYKQDQLKNKFNSLRTRWSDFSTILKENGVAYNVTTGQVIATNDVWAKLMKVNRSASCLMYESLCRIYGDTTATGRLQNPFTKVPSKSVQEDIQSRRNESIERPMDKGKHEEVESQSHRPSKRSKKNDVSSALTSTLKILTDNSRKKLELLDNRIQMSSAPSTEQSETLLSKCIHCLDLMEDVDDNRYFKAMEKFQQDPFWMQMFLRISDSRKMAWILSLGN